jgi:hypothetical protein
MSQVRYCDMCGKLASQDQLDELVLIKGRKQIEVCIQISGDADVCPDCLIAAIKEQQVPKLAQFKF